jgi:hypothetical protein
MSKEPLQLSEIDPPLNRRVSIHRVEMPHNCRTIGHEEIVAVSENCRILKAANVHLTLKQFH